MQAKTKYEEEILRRVQLLPEEQLPKVIFLLEKLEEENKKKNYQQAIKELSGKYKDALSSTEEFMRNKEEEKKLER